MSQPILKYLDIFPKISNQASGKQYLLRIYSEPEVQKDYVRNKNISLLWPWGHRAEKRPRITELSLVAVNTESILDLNEMLLSQSKVKVERMLPRVMNKLTVCVYPMATIRPEVSGITGLDNYNLSGQATFDKETGVLINSFLARFPKPLGDCCF